MKSLLREPLLHFLVLGGLLFLWSELRGETRADASRLVVSAGQIEHLATTFAATWQRPPTAEELALLVRDHVREELACREALALGLEQDDTIVRRRLRQKLEFLVGDLAAQQTPSEAELAAFLAAHPDAFREPPTFTFRHVYLAEERHAELEADARALLVRLAAGEEPATLGDASLLPAEFEGVTAEELDALFGPGFAQALEGLALERFDGPVASSYGLHLVRLAAREPGRLPPLAEVRAEVEDEWLAERRAAELEEFYRRLEERQEIHVEYPSAPQAEAR